MGGQFSRKVERMHNVYGLIVRINLDELHIDDSDWFAVFYASQSVET